MRSWLVFLLAALMTACVSIEPRTDEAGTTPAPTFDQDDAPLPRSSTAEVVEKVLPSLVNVRVRGFSGASETQGQGSGAIIDSDGIILTNAHVVQGAVRVQVAFTDGNESVDGRVIGFDLGKDLAVIKVPTSGLTPIKIGRSQRLRLGDDVIALGFPLGLGGPTVTKGIVSGTNRSLRVPSGDEVVDFEGLLQTDAAINPGNSGGPLVDAAGRLVGINTAAAGAAAAENVGFAIAIDTALPVVEEILAEPAEERAWLGVLGGFVNATTASQCGIDADETGALIQAVVRDGPAAEAGIETCDVIVAIGDEPVEGPEALTRALTAHAPGDTVTVEIVDESGTNTVEVTLGQRPVPPEE